MTLRGTNIAGEFEALVNDYIEKRYGTGQAAAE
jgi:(E)-4-hydroxy-3-methylbut-2-enyl-diphosphate synthase